MESKTNLPEFVLIYIVANFGMGSKFLKVAKENGIQGGTILLGMGTMKNPILEFLSLNDVRKEVIMMAAEKDVAYAAMEVISKKFELHKPYHGIAFMIPLPTFLGTEKYGYAYKTGGGEEKAMYNSIMVIVEKGKSGEVMDAAISAGARGGTVINARGSGIHETSKLFNMQIEPIKEIVLILSEVSNTDNIMTTIREKLDIDKPGHGVMFCQDVVKAYGIS